MALAFFLQGLIVGALLGLAVAPLLRAWVGWRMVEDARRESERYHAERMAIERERRGDRTSVD